MRAASFFTGAGGFDIGFEQAGIEIVFQCEKDKYCNQLLEKHYPNVIRANDITTLHPRAIPYADIYFGGFPCQNASTAGNREGLAGDRTGLFFDFVRLIKANKPQWIVLENVFGLLSSGGREDFKRVVESLAQCGYYLSWRVLDSQHFGVSQRRRRIFIVGCLGDWRSPFQVLFESEIKASDLGQGRKDESGVTREIGESVTTLETTYLSGAGRKLHHYENLTPTLCAADKAFALLDGDQLRYPTPEECEKLQGFEARWTEDFSDTQRYKMTGNAVSVPVAKFIGQRIVDVHSNLVRNHWQKGIVAA